MMNIEQKAILEKRRAYSYKSLTLKDESIEVDESSRTVTGYFASFNTKDDAQDIILEGAFSKSIEKYGPDSSSARKIGYLWQHNHTLPLGPLQELVQNEKGLWFKGKIDKIQLGDDVLVQYKSGTLNQHSFGFYYIFDAMKWSDKDEAWYISDLHLLEGSVVTFGCNENTPFTGFSKSIMSIDDAIKELDTSLLQVLENLPEIKQAQLRQLVAKYQSIANYDILSPKKSIRKKAENEISKITQKEPFSLFTNKAKEPFSLFKK